MQNSGRCCSFKLKSIGLLIGFLDAIAGIIGTSLCSVLLLNKNGITQFKFPIYVGDEHRHYILPDPLAFLILAILQIFTSILLIFGICKKLNIVLKVWLFYKIAFIVFLVCLYIINPIVTIKIVDLVVVIINVIFTCTILYLQKKLNVVDDLFISLITKSTSNSTDNITERPTVVHLH